jgi:hypothetical protein
VHSELMRPTAQAHNTSQIVRTSKKNALEDLGVTLTLLFEQAAAVSRALFALRCPAGQ